jgi:hypothetical protein
MIFLEYLEKIDTLFVKIWIEEQKRFLDDKLDFDSLSEIEQQRSRLWRD